MNDKRACVSVDRLAFKRALDRLWAICGGSLLSDGLVTVHVSGESITLVLHGTSRATVSVECKTDDGAPYEVVTLVAALRAAIKERSADRLFLHAHVDTLCVSNSGGVLSIITDVWTANAVPVLPLRGPAVAASPEHVAVAAAIDRALPFVCEDQTRGIGSVRLRGAGDRLALYATDGYVLSVEHVHAPELAAAIGDKGRSLPLGLIQALRKGQKKSPLRVGVHGDILVAACGGTLARGEGVGTYPPVDTFVSEAQNVRGLDAELRWSETEVVDACTWLAELPQESTVTMQVAGKDGTPVAVRLQSTTNVLVLGDAQAVFVSEHKSARGRTAFNTWRDFSTHYLLTCLCVFTGAAVRLVVTPDSLGPFYLTDVPESVHDRIVLTMPKKRGE